MFNILNYKLLLSHNDFSQADTSKNLVLNVIAYSETSFIFIQKIKKDFYLNSFKNILAKIRFSKSCKTFSVNNGF